MENRTIDVAGRRYTVTCDGDALSVRVHCYSKPGRYCVAFRRLPLRSAAALRAVDAAEWGHKINPEIRAGVHKGQACVADW